MLTVVVATVVSLLVTRISTVETVFSAPRYRCRTCGSVLPGTVRISAPPELLPGAVTATPCLRALTDAVGLPPSQLKENGSLPPPL